METNLLIAFSNLIKDPTIDLSFHYRSLNRANNMGDALEFYIKDLFCSSLHESILSRKNIVYSKYFSYLGNQNNPPDIIIKNGDAIEVKKIGNPHSGIALNSSYPKSKLYAKSQMITSACRGCEKWEEKDLIYAVGVAKEKKLKSLWFVYGDCYAADARIYEKISDKIAKGIGDIPRIELAKSKELGRVNKVDPLGITYLRIRGMWGIENPSKAFNYIYDIDHNTEFYAAALILKEKYLSFPEVHRKSIEKMVNKNFIIKDVSLKSPNNPAMLLEAKLLFFQK